MPRDPILIAALPRSSAPALSPAPPHLMLGGIQVAIEETLEDSFCAELVDPAQHGMAFGVLATVNGVGDFLSSAMVGLLWSTLGQTVAFGYTAVLFLTGAILVVRIGSVTSSRNAVIKPDAARWATTRGIYYGHRKHPEERGGSVDQ